MADHPISSPSPQTQEPPGPFPVLDTIVGAAAGAALKYGPKILSSPAMRLAPALIPFVGPAMAVGIYAGLPIAACLALRGIGAAAGWMLTGKPMPPERGGAPEPISSAPPTPEVSAAGMNPLALATLVYAGGAAVLGCMSWDWSGSAAVPAPGAPRAARPSTEQEMAAAGRLVEWAETELAPRPGVSEIREHIAMARSEIDRARGEKDAGHRRAMTMRSADYVTRAIEQSPVSPTDTEYQERLVGLVNELTATARPVELADWREGL